MLHKYYTNCTLNRKPWNFKLPKCHSIRSRTMCLELRKCCMGSRVHGRILSSFEVLQARFDSNFHTGQHSPTVRYQKAISACRLELMILDQSVFSVYTVCGQEARFGNRPRHEKLNENIEINNTASCIL